MIRSLHRLPGLVAAALLVVLALSGAALSVLPAVEAAGDARAAGGRTQRRRARRPRRGGLSRRRTDQACTLGPDHRLVL